MHPNTQKLKNKKKRFLALQITALYNMSPGNLKGAIGISLDTSLNPFTLDN